MNKWTKYFLEMAKHSSTLSKDPSTRIGAIAVGKHNNILSTGYNGFPRGVKDTPNRLNNREMKYSFISHGEMNCIFNACLNGVSLENSTLYVYGLPVCSECAKGVIQTGIKKVIMQCDDLSDKWKLSYELTKTMFNEAEVDYILYDGQDNIV